MTKVAVDVETSSASFHNPNNLLLTGMVASSGEERTFFGHDIPDWFFSMLEDPKITKLMHNSSFETKALLRVKHFIPRNVVDTAAQEQVLVQGKGIDCKLSSVAFRRLGINLDKTLQSEFLGKTLFDITPEDIEYNLNDCRYLLPIADQQVVELKRSQQEFVGELENNISLVTGFMEYEGVDFDTDRWYKLMKVVNAKIFNLTIKIYDQLGVDYSLDFFTGAAVGGINLNSRETVLHYLRRIGIYLDDFKSDTLLEYHLKNPSVQVITDLIEYKKYSKASTWRYPEYIDGFTGKIHTKYFPRGAETFRFTSRDPNLQNVTKPFGEINFRNLFCAPPGYVWFGLDYNQIELRLLTVATGEPFYVDAYTKDIDMHIAMTEQLLKRKCSSEERNLGKIVNFGVVAYKGSAYTLAGTALDYGLLIPFEEAEEYVRIIRRKNTRIESWGKDVWQGLLKDRFIRTPMGHIRYFMGGDSELKETTARNTHIQMFAAGIIKQAMVDSFYYLAKHHPKAKILLQVHDEMGGICPKEEADAVLTALKNIMVETGSKWMGNIPCKVKAYISDRWEKD